MTSVWLFWIYENKFRNNFLTPVKALIVVCFDNEPGLGRTWLRCEFVHFVYFLKMRSGSVYHQNSLIYRFFCFVAPWNRNDSTTTVNDDLIFELISAGHFNRLFECERFIVRSTDVYIERSNFLLQFSITRPYSVSLCWFAKKKKKNDVQTIPRSKT